MRNPVTVTIEAVSTKRRFAFQQFYNTNAILVSLYLTFLVALRYDPLENIAVSSFKRILGVSLLHAVDIEKRIRNFYFWYLVVGPLLFLLSFIVISWLLNKAVETERKEAYGLLNSVSILAGAGLARSYLFRYTGRSTPMQSFYDQLGIFMVGIVILAVLAGFLLRKGQRLVRFSFALGTLSFILLLFMTDRIQVREGLFGVFCILFALGFPVLVNLALKLEKREMNFLHGRGVNTEEGMYGWIRNVAYTLAVSVYLDYRIYGLYRTAAEPETINVIDYAVMVSLCLLVLSVAYVLVRKHVRLGQEGMEWILIFALPLTAASLFMFPQVLGSGARTFVTGYVLGVILLSVIMEVMLRTRILNQEKMARVRLAAQPMMFAFAAVSIFLEVANILNQRDVFVRDRAAFSGWILAAALLFSIARYVFQGLMNSRSKDWKGMAYPGLILSISLLSAQPLLQTRIFTDLFESANHGLIVSEFFRYGKIPLVETFDAHMMSNSIGGILFSVLNRDVFSGMFLNYGEYLFRPILMLLFYKLLKAFFNRDFAFFMVLLIPLSPPIIYADFAYLAIFAVIRSFHKDSFGGYLLYWSSLVLICVYRLDSGFAFSVATVAAFLATALVKKEKFRIRNYLTSFVLVITVFFSGYFLISIVKGFDGVVRLREILSIISSNVNWAYHSIGESQVQAYLFSYVAIPFTVVALLSALAFFVWTKRVRITSDRLLILFTLGFAYVANISRALVRHSVQERQLQTVLYTAVVFIALSAATFVSRYRKEVFLLLLVGMVVFTAKQKPLVYINRDSIMTTSLTRLMSGELVRENPDSRVQRAVLSQEMKDKYQLDGTVRMIRALMDGKETYLDFTNQSLLYALSDKEKPVYVNQSPGLLSGEYSQERFLEQVEQREEDVVFALLPVRDAGLSHILDRIANPYRYYKVSEYISQNYRPLYSYGELALWVRMDRYEEVRTRLDDRERMADVEGAAVDYSYSDLEKLHTYDLKQLPYIWGTYDEEESHKNPVVEGNIEDRGGYYDIDLDGIPKEKGNYLLLEADTAVQGNAAISFGKMEDGVFQPLNRFTFEMNPGKGNRYMLRVSSDFLWYSGEIDAFTLEVDTPVDNAKITLLEGD
jgi:hypothetical protein